MSGVSATAAQTRPAPKSDPLINDVRREITEIVREVAQAVHGDRTETQFLAFVSDRVLRAMAAEGIVIWRRTGEPHANRFFQSLIALGHITDSSAPVLNDVPHQQLLIEVADEQQPVVVPPTPDLPQDSVAIDGPRPINPTQVPAAVVPIESDPTATQWSYVMQVFLEPECGVATQRGYLRFVAQMADLTGEFLRLNQFRQMRLQHDLAADVDRCVRDLHTATDSASVAALTVDAIADIFGFDRVGLCVCVGGRWRLDAVSHVDTIDQRSPAAEQIRQAAGSSCRDETLTIWPNDSAASSEDDMCVRAVVAPEHPSRLRCVLMSGPDHDFDFDVIARDLHRLVEHAQLAQQAAAKRTRVPGAKWLSAVMPSPESDWTRWRNPLLVVGFALVLLLIAILPLPVVIVADATIRPADVQTLTAPRDVTVQKVHVHHGQVVQKGELLLTLVDTDLQQEIVMLAGKRAVLTQQQSRWTNAIVTAESTYAASNEHVQSEQRLVDEEIRSIDQQLALLRSVEESLAVRADRDGTVDAWRVDDRLQHRPLRRGEHLLQVVGKDSPWLVDAKVPQKRILRLEESLDEGCNASVALLSRPDQTQSAALVRMGPATVDLIDGQPATTVVLKLEHDAVDRTDAFGDASVQAGAPATVRFHCGTMPAASLLFQDVFGTIRSTLAIYFGSPTTEQGDRT